jgi:hypothetical protein
LRFLSSLFLLNHKRVEHYIPLSLCLVEMLCLLRVLYHHSHPFHDPCSLIEDRPLIFHYPTRHKLAPIQVARFAPIFHLTPSELLSLLGLKTGRFSVKRWSSNDEPIQLQVLFLLVTLVC